MTDDLGEPVDLGGIDWELDNVIFNIGWNL